MVLMFIVSVQVRKESFRAEQDKIVGIPRIVAVTSKVELCNADDVSDDVRVTQVCLMPGYV